MDDSTRLEASGVESFEVAATGLLAVVADPVRWRLLAHLAGGEPTCVCELRPVAAVAGNLLSYHLKVLRDADLVTAEKRGRWVFYTLAADALDRLHAALPALPAAPLAAAGGSSVGAR